MKIKQVGTTMVIENNGKTEIKKCANKEHLDAQIRFKSHVFKSKKVYDRKKKYGRYDD